MEFKKEQTTTTTAKSTMAVHVRYNSSFISLPFFTKQQHGIPHSACCREREIRRPIFTISFSNFDAVVYILFKISLTVIDQLSECKFLAARPVVG